MKKMLLMILVLALALPTTMALYAQTGKAPVMMPQGLNNFNYYINTPVAGEINNIKAGSNAYVDSPAEKMGTGAINAATAWTDIPRQMGEVTDRYNLLLGLTYGFGKGVVTGVTRGVSGAFDMATCGLPPYDKPMVKPEYKSEDPNKELKISILKW